MPELAQELTITNTGQPLAPIITPATEIEAAQQAVVTPVTSQTVTISPVAE